MLPVHARHFFMASPPYFALLPFFLPFYLTTTLLNTFFFFIALSGRVFTLEATVLLL